MIHLNQDIPVHQVKVTQLRFVKTAILQLKTRL